MFPSTAFPTKKVRVKRNFSIGFSIRDGMEPPPDLTVGRIGGSVGVPLPTDGTSLVVSFITETECLNHEIEGDIFDGTYFGDNGLTGKLLEPDIMQDLIGVPSQSADGALPSQSVAAPSTLASAGDTYPDGISMRPRMADNSANPCLMRTTSGGETAEAIPDEKTAEIGNDKFNFSSCIFHE